MDGERRIMPGCKAKNRWAQSTSSRATCKKIFPLVNSSELRRFVVDLYRYILQRLAGNVTIQIAPYGMPSLSNRPRSNCAQNEFKKCYRPKRFNLNYHCRVNQLWISNGTRNNTTALLFSFSSLLLPQDYILTRLLNTSAVSNMVSRNFKSHTVLVGVRPTSVLLPLIEWALRFNLAISIEFRPLRPHDECKDSCYSSCSCHWNCI